MELLYWLQLHRTPLGEWIFGAVTHMGSQLIVMAALCVLIWLFGRRVALRVAISFGCTALANQLIKVICAVPRPWVRDSRLTPVESAVPGATGYSFPSGHTQTATSLYTSIALNFKRRWLSACCAVCILGVMCSRMYLGVHTPLDVATGCVVSLGITCALNRLLRLAERSPHYYRNVFAFGALTALSALALISVSVALGTPFDMVSDALPAIGGALGFLGGIYLSSRCPEELPPFGVGLVLSIAGLMVLAGLQLALECVLAPLPDAHFRGFVRYLVLALYVTCVHPAAMRAVQRRLSIPARNSEMV